MSGRGVTPATSSGHKESLEKQPLVISHDETEGVTATSPISTSQDRKKVNPHTSKGNIEAGNPESSKTEAPESSPRTEAKRSPRLEASKKNPGSEAAKNPGSGGCSPVQLKNSSKQNTQPGTEQKDRVCASGSSRPTFTIGERTPNSSELVTFPEMHSGSYVTRGGLAVSHMTGNEFVTVHSNFLRPVSMTQRRSWTDGDSQVSGGSLSPLPGRRSPMQEARVVLETAGRSSEETQLTSVGGAPNRTLLRRIIHYMRTVFQINCNKRLRNCLIALFGLTGGAVFLIDSYARGTLDRALSEGVVTDIVELMIAILGIIFGSYYFTFKEVLPYIRRRRRTNPE